MCLSSWCFAVWVAVIWDMIFRTSEQDESERVAEAGRKEFIRRERDMVEGGEEEEEEGERRWLMVVSGG
jgi:hypothetical protein